MARAPAALLPALLFVRLADEWFSFFPAGALESIRGGLGLTYAEAGLILTALAAGGLLGNGFAAAADFVDRRKLAVGGALAYAPCLLAFAVGDSLPLLMGAALVWGMASDALAHGCEVALADLYPDDLPAVMGRVNALGALGDLLGPLTLAAVVALGLGWRAAFAGGAALMLLYALWLAARPFPPPNPRSEADTPLKAVREVVRDRRILLLALVDGLFSLLDEPFWGFAVALFERERGASPEGAAAIVSIGVAGGVVGFVGVPLISRRRATAWLLPRLALVLGLAAVGLIAAPEPLTRTAAAFAFGLAGAAFYSLLQATIFSLRPGQAGTSKAVVSTIGFFGIAVPTLVGAVSDVRGLVVGLALYAAVPFAIALLLMASRPGRASG